MAWRPCSSIRAWPSTWSCPAMPVRRKPLPAPVQLTSSSDLLTEDQETGLEDQVALERWLPAFFPCARFISPDTGSEQVDLAVRVGSNGAVADVVGLRDRLSACMAEVARGRKLPPGRERMLELNFELVDPQLPVLQVSAEAADEDGRLRVSRRR